MKCFHSAFAAILLFESVVARPFGLPWSRRGIPAFAKRAFLEDSVLPLRGGYQQEEEELTMAQQQQQHVHQEHDFDDNHQAHMPPLISAADMALALRWTGEINRRLDWGTRPDAATLTTTRGPLVTAVPVNDSSHPYYPTDMRGGGGEVTADSLSFAQEESFAQEDTAPTLTLFHAKSPRPTGNGANRWGPNLEAYISHICQELQLTADAAPELSLALMYLDRATSAETPRSQGLAPAVPFLQPRTVHRLVLAALLLATHTTQGWPLPVLMERVESLGIPPEQLSQMLQWMHHALVRLVYFLREESDCIREGKLTQASVSCVSCRETQATLSPSTRFRIGVTSWRKRRV